MTPLRDNEARLAGICANDPGSTAGADGGGGGGGGGAPATGAAPATSAPASAPAAAPSAAPARPATNVPLDRAGLAEHMRMGVRSAATNAPPVSRPAAATPAPAAAARPGAPVQNAAGRWYDPTTGRMVAAPAGTPPAAAPAAAAPAAAPQTDMDRLIGRLDRLIPQLAQPAPAATPAAAADPASTPFYGGYAGPVTLQPEVFELLESEHPDDRAQGLTTLVNQSLNTVMRDTIALVTAMRNDVLAQIAPIVANIVAQQAAHNGFYDRYPQLNRPELRPLLDQVGRAVANEWQQRGMMGRAANGALTPEFMDAVYARYAEVVNGTVGMPSAAAPAPIDPGAAFGHNTPAAAPAAQPFLRRTAARPPAASPLAAKSADILHTISTR